MTFRLSLAAFALALLPVAAGCQGSSEGTADVSDIENAGPFEQVAYNVGFQSGQQFLSQDSSFSFDRFMDGFRKGVAGDSAEMAYAIGLQYGLQIRQDTLGTIDREIFLAGLRSALRGDSMRVSQEAFMAAQAVVEDSLELRRLRAQAASDPSAQQRLEAIRRNGATADSFLTAASRKEGVRELRDGIYYSVTTPGEGAKPQPGDRVSIRYVGQFPNGQVFDQSPEGETATFSVEQVVPGFREALLDMKEGETRTVYLPADQAYGILGQPGPGGQGGIPPNTALQFEITLVEVGGSAPPPQFQLPPGMGQ